MRRSYVFTLFTLLLGGLTSVQSRPSPNEIDPLYEALSTGVQHGHPSLEPRVPLSTNDDTVSPLIDLQVYAPPVVPTGGLKCTVELLTHVFGDGSYGVPAVVPYNPPTQASCGRAGNWAAVTLNLTVFSNGTQYDRLSSLYLSNVETRSQLRRGPCGACVKDVTHYSALFAVPGQLLMDFSNIVSADLGLDGVFHVTLTGTFHAPTRLLPKPATSDVILPLTNLSPNQSNFFTIADDLGGTTQVTIPRTAQQAVIELYASGNAEEEFWYLNTPDAFLPFFPESSGLIGKGPFREVQALVDGRLAGVAWPHAVIYTGGITPTNWRPLTAYGTYDQPTYFVDVTPFLPVLTDGEEHAITLRVLGQGRSPSINSNWFVSGSLHLWLGETPLNGRMTKYDVVADPFIRTVGGASAGNKTVWTSVVANRSLLVESILHTDRGEQVVRFEQHFGYSNEQKYADDGLVQWGQQLTEGTTESIYGGRVVLRDAFSFPLSVFSNYSLYDLQFGAYGSAINQTYSRVLQSPVLAHGMRTTLSIQHAQGWVGMDDAPGLRHAINGTGATDQDFAFTTDSGESYFRRIAAKNDAWLRDEVWGTLRDAEPPVPKEQIFPGGGPGFRRALGGRARRAV
ncbi:hypothetical protein BV20DRAFT_961408 [Pilatotrama ljubarskyi]|nr:hypothetical protein BV20DRAFT_961408 [Pilatotrama ljubarskyi]